MTELARRVYDAFLARYGREPRLYWAPGRVNLIGEHTDYNGGFVMPAALDLGTVAAVAPRGDARLRLASLDLPGELDVPLEALRPRGDWTDYAAGVAVQTGRREGVDVLYGSTVPLGGGFARPPAVAQPMAPPVAPGGTFPYDGGPANPVPLPKADPNAAPPADPTTATDLPISLKPKPAAPQYKYKAYGEK